MISLNPIVWIRNLVVSKYIASALRTGLAALSGILAALGLGLDPEMLARWASDTAIIGTAVAGYLIVQFWSWWDKRSVK